MKKLIIIGNGFDLSHGLPTSYRDFIVWLVKKEFREMNAEEPRKKRRKQFPLFSCSINMTIKDFDAYVEKDIYDIMKACQSKRHFDVGFPGSSYGTIRESTTQPLSIKTDSIFGKNLILNSCGDWVDIEDTYYNCLKIILHESKKSKQYNKQEAVKELNTQLNYLCENLKQYLLDLPQGSYIDVYRDIITKPIDHSLLFTAFNKSTPYNHHASDTYVLNFNYTNTVAQYVDIPNVSINQIHGSITDEHNPMIFGYGDELDDDFEEMEKESIDGFLKHVKSLWYLRTKNYHDLLRFIESQTYQVQIIGHSCGRSDRTLLNMIFEHENCNSIDIFYRMRDDGTDNFNEICEDISRQFRDKQKLRKRVLPKNRMNVLPQYKAQGDKKLEVAI